VANGDPARESSGPPTGPESGYAQLLLRGAFVQQLAQAASIIAGLATATVLARTLSLQEFGFYGLIVTLNTYSTVFVGGGTLIPLVRRVAAARDRAERDRAFTTGLLAFSALAVLAAGLIMLVGAFALALLSGGDVAAHDLRKGVVAMSIMIGIGFLLRPFQGALRGLEMYVSAASAEGLAFLEWAVLVILSATAFGFPLWGIIAVGGSLGPLFGLNALVVHAARGFPVRISRSGLTARYMRGFIGEASKVTLAASSTLAITGSDRLILAGLSTPSALGLYEGARRPYNFVDHSHGSLVRNVIPASTRFVVAEDTRRDSELLLRGSRYVVGFTLPLVVSGLVLAEPLLGVWLGDSFRAAAPAMTILLATWLFKVTTGVPSAMLYARDKSREMAIYMWSVGAVSLPLSVALTALIGLEGVAIGTFVGSLLLLPYFFRLVTRHIGVPVRDLWHGAWSNACGLAAALAGLLVVCRVTGFATEGVAVFGLLVGGVLLYWIAFFVIGAEPRERLAVRRLILPARSNAGSTLPRATAASASPGSEGHAE
jgi:O-antigen/teichoic acid export membrane protein